MTRIAAVASAFPRQYYRQGQIAEALKRHWDEGLGNPKVLDRLSTRVGVEGRYLALPIEAYDDLTTWGKSNNAWIEVAEDLAEQSICRALASAGLTPPDLDAIFFVSVTGIASPSIEGRLINRMNLRPDIKRIPIFGLGCVAGAAGVAARSRLCSGISQAVRGVGVSGTVLAHLAKERSFGRQYHFLRPLRGWFGGSDPGRK